MSRIGGTRPDTSSGSRCRSWQSSSKWRSDLGRLIEDTPELDWLLLAKRPENYEKLAPWHLDKIPPNVWLGVTCEDQPHYERRWAILSRARIKASVKFVSYEPALGSLTKLQLQWGGRVPDWIHLRWRVWYGCTPHEARMGPGRARPMRRFGHRIFHEADRQQSRPVADEYPRQGRRYG